MAVLSFMPKAAQVAIVGVVSAPFGAEDAQRPRVFSELIWILEVGLVNVLQISNVS